MSRRFPLPLKTACQNNACFCWPHGKHRNCANPSRWCHCPRSIYHVCAFKRLKKLLVLWKDISSFISVLKIAGNLYNLYPYLERQCRGKHHCWTPNFLKGLTKTKPLWNMSEHNLSVALCFDSPCTKQSLKDYRKMYCRLLHYNTSISSTDIKDLARLRLW